MINTSNKDDFGWGNKIPTTGPSNLTNGPISDHSAPHTTVTHNTDKQPVTSQKPTSTYSTLRGKTDKLEEPVNRELNITKNWNFMYIVNLA